MLMNFSLLPTHRRRSSLCRYYRIQLLMHLSPLCFRNRAQIFSLFVFQYLPSSIYLQTCSFLIINEVLSHVWFFFYQKEHRQMYRKVNTSSTTKAEHAVPAPTPSRSRCQISRKRTLDPQLYR